MATAIPPPHYTSNEMCLVVLLKEHVTFDFCVRSLRMISEYSPHH